MKVFVILSLIVFVTFTTYAQYTWQLKRTGNSLGNPIAVDRYNSDIIYYGETNKIYRSSDRGETFTQYGSVIPSASNIKAVILSAYDSNTMLVATTNQIVKTTDAGITWVPTAQGLSFSFFGIPMTVDHKHPDTIYTMNGSIFMKSINFGSSWTEVTSSVGCETPCDIEVFADSSNVILIGDNGTGIFRSSNYGQTWTQVYSTSGEIPTIAVDKIEGGIAWATKWGGGGGFLKSTDYGATWIPLTFFNSKNMWGVDVSPTMSDYVMTGMYSGGVIYISKDKGNSWIPTNITSSNYAIYIVDTVTIFAAQGNGFYKLNSPYFIPVELTAFTASAEGEYVVISWSTATETNNRGFEIEQSSDNENFETAAFVPGAGSTSSAKHYTYRLRNTSSGKMYYRLKQIDFDGTFTRTHSVEVEGFMPAVYNLSQNYPNPFNPSTTISFALPVDAKVNLRIFNLIGEEISSAAEEYTAGIYNITFDASNLPSGIYFYAIEAKGNDGSSFLSTRKMTLLK